MNNSQLEVSDVLLFDLINLCLVGTRRKKKEMLMLVEFTAVTPFLTMLGPFYYFKSFLDGVDPFMDSVVCEARPRPRPLFPPDRPPLPP